MIVAEDNDDHEEDCLAILRSMREEVDWEIEEERYPFFRRLVYLTHKWTGQLPDLRDFFRPEEMDWLLAEDVKNEDSPDVYFNGFPLIGFVIRSGYKDRPELDEATGRPVRLRTTAVHQAAAGLRYFFNVDSLFRIYSRYDVNYVDELGLTHFHVACKFNCYRVAERFLELGQDPDCLDGEESTSSLINPPLHLALEYGLRDLAELLLRHGADANLATAYGLTPLHVVCRRDHDVLGPIVQCEAMVLLQMLFETGRADLKVDARDNLDRTPLQWAVANLMPGSVEYLLARGGADPSSFVFPSEDYFGDRYRRNRSNWAGYRYNVAADALRVFDCLKRRAGYELTRADVLTVMRFFVYLEKIPNADDDDDNSDDEDDDREEQQHTSSCRVCRAVIAKPPTAAASLCRAHRFAKTTRGFFQRWAVEFFATLTRYRLPLLCSEKIVGMLGNEHVLTMCTASEMTLKEQSEDKEVEDLKNLHLNE
ncbi:uncharacterized protein LOC111693481 [Trichogramma pretiosum]|uniref:uncharacterized protein LOC111693481 n=1 Tax=Trichogramma pretiosum TaxID=7493 RepID=UPI000C71AE6A|nr:uncharacterized protein LOC111693481 [Trichogramma pretiosum]